MISVCHDLSECEMLLSQWCRDSGLVQWIGRLMSDIGLGEAIKALREQLTEARGEGDGSWMRFQVGPVSLELELVVTKDAHGQVGWKILEAGGTITSERTQKVSLTLTPQWWDGAKRQYTTDFLVAGTVTLPEVPSQGDEKSGPPGVPETDADPEDEE